MFFSFLDSTVTFYNTEVACFVFIFTALLRFKAEITQYSTEKKNQRSNNAKEHRQSRYKNTNQSRCKLNKKTSFLTESKERH